MHHASFQQKLFAGPVTGWLGPTAEALYDPAAIIAATRLDAAP